MNNSNNMLSRRKNKHSDKNTLMALDASTATKLNGKASIYRNGPGTAGACLLTPSEKEEIDANTLRNTTRTDPNERRIVIVKYEWYKRKKINKNSINSSSTNNNNNKKKKFSNRKMKRSMVNLRRDHNILNHSQFNIDRGINSSNNRFSIIKESVPTTSNEGSE